MSEHETMAIPNDELIPRTLAARLLEQPRFSGFRGQSEESTEILVGRLPDLSVELPIPDGATVLGSAVREGGFGPSASIILDTPRTPDEARAFYRDRLPGDGWTLTPWPAPQQGGFQPPTDAGSPLLFCRGERGPALYLHTAPSGGGTALRLDIHTDARHSPCRTRNRAPHGGLEFIPPLVAPDGARRVWMEGGGGGDSSAHTTAVLEGDLDLAVAAAHYTAHLEGAGWRATASGQDGQVAWSRWSSNDDEGQEWEGALLILTQGGSPRRYLLHLRMTAVEGNGAGRNSWTSSTSAY